MDFLGRWSEAERKQAILDELKDQGASFEVSQLAVANSKELDEFDLVAHIAFNQKCGLPAVSRSTKPKSGMFLPSTESKHEPCSKSSWKSSPTTVSVTSKALRYWSSHLSTKSAPKPKFGAAFRQHRELRTGNTRTGAGTLRWTPKQKTALAAKTKPERRCKPRSATQ